MILTGKSAAPGVVVGSIYIYNKKYIIPAESFITEEEKHSHLDLYLSIKEKAINKLEELKQSLQKIDPAKAEIFTAHQEIVDDILINEEIPARILNDLWAGDWAVYQVYETFIDVLRQTTDPFITERIDDFDDVRALLLKLWYGQESEKLSSLKEPVIIASHDLKPSDTANFDKNKILAILTETGGTTSHTAIIAKSYGIPTVMGIEGLLGFVKQGQCAAVNAADGEVILDPDDELKNDFLVKSDAFMRNKADTEVFRNKECFTSCGEKIDIGINISEPDNKEVFKAAMYTDFTGLFRTEFLFLGRNSLPSEEEQFACYRKVLECYGKKPVVLRTLDIGADKQIPCMEIKREKNPFLGNRGIRFCFNSPEIFKTQIRAALRASVYGNLWLMLPMVNSLDDIRKAKESIEEVKQELSSERIGVVKTGIMIEVPSIALIADLAAKEVDFASIGSNDLCQYLCAADRMESSVEGYYQSYHPAMFRLIKKIAESFAREEKPLSICGELGGDPLAVPLLIGLGLRKFSMGEAGIARVKSQIASISIEKARRLADEALGLSTAEEVLKFLSG